MCSAQQSFAADGALRHSLGALLWRNHMINFFLAILLTTCFVQDESKLPSDFTTLQKVSIEELKLKTQMHAAAWGLDTISGWDLEQDTGELTFSFADGMKA